MVRAHHQCRCFIVVGRVNHVVHDFVSLVFVINWICSRESVSKFVLEPLTNNFRNVPENAVTDWIYMSPGNLDPPQFFFKK